MLTVTTPAESDTLVSLDILKATLGISGSSQDEALESYIDRASDFIARQCKRAFGLATYDETFRLARLNERLVLSRYPVAAIESVVEDGTTLDSDQYELDADSGILTRLHGGRACWWPISTTIVTYQAGFDLPDDSPGALQQATMRLVTAWRAAAARDPALRSSAVEGIGTNSYQVTTDMLPEIAGLIAPFRDGRVR